MIETEDVVAITQNVFSTMLEMEPFPISADATLEQESEMVGSIEIVGEWSGTVLLRAPEALASEAGSRMLMMNADEVGEADRQDTVAELTNMIGGNIKSIVPSPSNLSLPTVTNGTDYRLRRYGSSVVSETSFQCNEHVFRVIVLEKD